jgi:hypothetical protein
MGEATKVVEKKKIVRKKPGFRKIMVTLAEEQAERLDEMAVADDRGTATNMLTVLVKRNFESLLKSFQPAQSSLPLVPKDLTIKEAE